MRRSNSVSKGYDVDYIDRLYHARARNSARILRRIGILEVVRETWLRRTHHDAALDDLYDYAASLVIEARNAGDRIHNAIRGEV